MSDDVSVYQRQGFGGALPVEPPIGLLIVDFVVSFASPDVFGGGNIGPAIEKTEGLLATARERGWPVAHTRIVYADDGSDGNVFSTKVPSMLVLTEASPLSQIVEELTPVDGELVVRKRTPSAFAFTDLAAWLTRRGVKTLAIAGCTTSGCVRASVVDAMDAGFTPVVLTDCVGDRAIGPHEANLFDMGQKYAELMERDAFLKVTEAA
ncbi:isochorismatase family protein [Acuticoccus kandeliae]|uniref:isochorismatase family protein n=1 Tax=Acuticoccus kandeliae TaxID=2073160 RepID=UPI000D3E4B35|nr:isochorismatase family protein [Acuticoccus kandeliae]